MRFDGLDTVILGAGVSGEAAADLVMRRGGRAVVLDRAFAPETRAALEARGVQCVTAEREWPAERFDLCVCSPSIPLEHPWLEACAARAIPVISEMELGAAYWPGRILAITGSKGKSSLVKFCADTLVRGGFGAWPCGNYGTPLSRIVLDHADAAGWAVVEVSSFQMEHTTHFEPDCAVLLNVQADHLDRHASMAVYRALKLSLFRRMRPGGLAVLPEGFDDEQAVPEGVARACFGTGADACWRYVGGRVEPPVGSGLRALSLAGTWFDNLVLGRAAAAGCAALSFAGLAPEIIEDGLRGFEALPHRVQEVVRVRGVRYVDDSKATSLAATAAAIDMVAGPVRLIAGGLLKEKDLSFIKDLLTRRVKKVYLIGDCASRMADAWSDDVPCMICGDIETATVSASRDAVSGETVLLSPGTASFDQFRSYHERGERFARQVRAITGM